MNNSTPILNLHSDLLGCVQMSPHNLNFESEEICCSLPQEFAGNIKVETFTLAVMSGNDEAHFAQKQVELYQQMISQYSKQVQSFKKASVDWEEISQWEKMVSLFAVENASALCGDGEPLDRAFDRFNAFNEVEKILYVSLTWNDQNRFGGGNITQVGLKEDGKTFLEFLSGKGVAIDFSHTSDQLAYDIFNHIEKKGLELPVMASHSNFRTVTNIVRNLPDEIAKEILRRDGIIGINFVRRFVGEDESYFVKHIEYALELGAENKLALGADFYGGLALPEYMQSAEFKNPFFETYKNASTFPNFVNMLAHHFSRDIANKIAYRNGCNFIQQLQKRVDMSKTALRTN